MSFKSILSGVAALTGLINPGVGAAIKIVNQFLPSDKGLPEGATGQNVMDAYDSMPEAQKAQADNRLAHELGLKQEDTKQIVAAYEHDNSGSSTRPKIALMSAYVVALITIGYLGLMIMGEKIPDWTAIAAITAPFILWVNTYMNARKQEKIARYNVASGHPAVGAIASIVQAFRK